MTKQSSHQNYLEKEIKLGRDLENYLDQWVAIKNQQVALSSPSLEGLMTLLESKHDPDQYSFFRVPKKAVLITRLIQG
jgi:hypothetical protein